MKRITIMVATKDRHSEISLLMQSLRTQSYTEWDLFIGDESQTPITNCHFLMSLIARLRHEGHGVEIIRNGISQGVCYIRNTLIDKNPWPENIYSARLDDDVVLDSDYLQKMMTVLKKYDIASGITPHMMSPIWERDVYNLGQYINDIELDKGVIKNYTDDCGMGYTTNHIMPATNFRSNAVYKTKITDDGVRYPLNLSHVGFREEAFFSLSSIIKGYKIGVHTGAMAWHIQSGSGGCRYPDYAECVSLDEKTFRKWVKTMYKKHGNFIKVYKRGL